MKPATAPPHHRTTAPHVQTRLSVVFKTVLLFLLSVMFVKAQTPQSYYILEKEGFSIEPTQKVINQDETLTLTFLDTALQNYFQGKTVYKYDLGFPTASSGYLSRVYEVTILGENLEM